MREFHKRRFLAIVESVMTMVAVACVVLNLISGDILGFALAMFWTCAQVGLVVIGFDLVHKARTHLDLREVYPPNRDRFHRDLERLNKLRGNVATKPASSPLPGDSYVQMPESVMEALREEMERERSERAANRSIRDKKLKKWLSSGNPATPDDYAMAIVFIVVLTALGLWMASQL